MNLNTTSKILLGLTAISLLTYGGFKLYKTYVKKDSSESIKHKRVFTYN